MKTHFRAVLEHDGVNTVTIHENATVDACGITMDNGKETISLWYACDTESPVTSVRKFVVLGTGANEDEMQYYNPRKIGTVIRHNCYAAHIFEVDM